MEDPFGKIYMYPPIINTKFCSTPICVTIVCTSCQTDQAKKQPPGDVKQKPVANKEGIYLWINMSPVILYLLISKTLKTPGLLPSG